ncbi:sigma factor [Streptomyces sp. NPDC059785]|uniref:sigma factor n=1 Tax=Streptomyces sp. NPDC059785 TaxID=3346945 RepID=UPI003655E1AC
MRSGTLVSAETPNDAVSAFIALRPRLLNVAHRVLGSAAGAEDIVQDAWLRWQRTDRAEVLNPPAFLTRTTVRLALNVAQSAHARHETHTPPSASATVDTSADPAALAEQAEKLASALRLLLERLDATERAAYVLRVAFDYPYSRIAGSLRTSEVNARQLVSRAGKRLSGGRRPRPVSAVEHRRLLTAFLTAARSGDLTRLEALLMVEAHRSQGGRSW